LGISCNGFDITGIAAAIAAGIAAYIHLYLCVGYGLQRGIFYNLAVASSFGVGVCGAGARSCKQTQGGEDKSVGCHGGVKFK
jgi:hypothetical protein